VRVNRKGVGGAGHTAAAAVDGVGVKDAGDIEDVGGTDEAATAVDGEGDVVDVGGLVVAVVVIVGSRIFIVDMPGWVSGCKVGGEEASVGGSV